MARSVGTYVKTKSNDVGAVLKKAAITVGCVGLGALATFGIIKGAEFHCNKPATTQVETTTEAPQNVTINKYYNYNNTVNNPPQEPAGDTIIYDNDNNVSVDVDINENKIISILQGIFGNKTEDNNSSETTTKKGETTTKAPETTTKKPETTTKAPETTTSNLGINTPENTTKAPETTTRAPETTTKVPETTTRAPETTTSNLGIDTNNQQNIETTTGKPVETTTQEYTTIKPIENTTVKPIESTTAKQPENTTSSINIGSNYNPVGPDLEK